MAEDLITGAPQLRNAGAIWRHPILPASLTLLVVLIATFLITSSYRRYNQTYDESAHIACGMEWLSLGTYTYEPLHPPLARAATALLPYLDGARTLGNRQMLVEGNALLHRDGRYWRNLTLSRLGTLPFFWFGCFLIYWWMARRFSAWHAAIATLLFAFCPPVLAHASLATTDAPVMSMFLWSLLALWACLERPDLTRAVLLGAAFGLAMLTKFTEAPFFLLAVAILFGYKAIRSRRFPAAWWLPGIVLLTSCFVIWAGYRFSFGAVFSSGHEPAEAQAKLDALSPRARWLLADIRVPAHEFFRGIIMAKGTGMGGRTSYLLGDTYSGGRWDFFPVALLTKTPISMLILALCTVVAICCVRRYRERPEMVLLLAGVAAPLIVGMTGQMNIGLRHILPVYPFLAMLAGFAAVELWAWNAERYKAARRGAVVLLLSWSVITCVWSAPDFLPYFNEIAAPYADRILVNSDLDWGQDLFRLEAVLHREQVPAVYVRYFGDPDIDMSGLPALPAWTPDDHPTGWIAISETPYQEEPTHYEWLAHCPYSLVGHSIRLYHLETLSCASGSAH